MQLTHTIGSPRTSFPKALSKTRTIDRNYEKDKSERKLDSHKSSSVRSHFGTGRKLQSHDIGLNRLAAVDRRGQYTQVAKDQSAADLPAIKPRAQQQQNPELSDTGSNINFGGFNYNSPRKNRQQQSNALNTVSLGRSVKQWSNDVRQSFCKGLYIQSSSCEPDKLQQILTQTNDSDRRLFDLTSGEATFKNSQHLMTMRIDETPRNVLLNEQSDASMHKQHFNQQFLSSSIEPPPGTTNEDSHQTLLSSPRASLKFKLYNSKQRESVKQLVNERIEQQCRDKLGQQLDVSSLAAGKKCHMLGVVQSVISRQKLLKQVTSRNHASPEMQVTTRQSPTHSQTFKEESELASPTLRQKARPKRQTEIDKSPKIDESNILEYEQKIWLQLHCSIQADEQLLKERPLEDTLVRYNMIKQLEQEKMKKANTEIEVPPEFVNQQKYQIYGDLAEKYARKDYIELLKVREREQQILKASKFNRHAPWSYERVAGLEARDKQDQSLYLLQRKKQKELERGDRVTVHEFQQKVESYVNDLNLTRNLQFSQKGLGVDESQASVSFSRPNLKRTYGGKQSSSLKSETSRSSLRSQIMPVQLAKKKHSRRQRGDGDITQLFGLSQENRFDMDQLAEHLRDKHAFQFLCKRAVNQPQTMQEIFQDDPTHQYFADCKKALEPALDLLNKIKNKQLVLEEYSLQQGCCSGFMKACELSSYMINSVFIDNCNLGSGALLLFLKGLYFERKIAQLSLKQIQIDTESGQQLGLLLSRLGPRNIDDFRLEDCQLSTDSMTTVLKALVQGNQLQKLAIVGQELNSDHIALLCEFINQSIPLNDLNLSYSRVSAMNFLPLLQCICNSKRLVYVNLAWVKLLRVSNFAEAQNSEEVRMQVDSRRNSVTSGFNQSVSSAFFSNEGRQRDKSKQAEPTVFQRSEHDQSVLNALVNLLTNNLRLFHLDLSETGLTNDIICRIIKPIKHSSSLIGIHLSGNPGITPETEKRILHSMKATYETQLNMASFQQAVNRMHQGQNKDLRTRSPRDRRSIQATDAMVIKQIQTQKRLQIQSKALGNVNNPQTRHFILTRKLGHQLEIPGSQSWVLHKESWDQCYICDRKIYSLFFWSPEIGQIEGYDLGMTPDEQYRIASYILEKRETNLNRSEKTMSLDPILTKKLVKQVYNAKIGEFEDEHQSEGSMNESEIVDSSEEIHEDAQPYTKYFKSLGPAIQIRKFPPSSMRINFTPFKDRNTPYIYGQFNNWQPQPMINVVKLAVAFDQEPEPDFIKLLKEKYLCRENVKAVKQMNDKERSYYLKYIYQYRDRFKTQQVWTKAIMKLVSYRMPHFAFLQNIPQVDISQLHVGANFIGSGRQDFMIQHGNQYSFHQTIADFRREDMVFPSLQKYEKGKIERNPDVFRAWQVDTPELLSTCCKYDFDYWKVPNFVKDSDDYDEIKTNIKQNYPFLLELFNVLSAQSVSFPCVTQLEFGNLIQQAGLCDKTFTQGICDTQFIAAKTDVNKNNFKVHSQSPHDINRFEFLECIVRVAHVKYKQTYLVQTYSEAIQTVIKAIEPLFAEHQTAQEFRRQELWTRYNNLAFDANRKAIWKLYDTLAKSKNRKLTKEECIRLMTKQTKIQLADNDATMCYGLSQQTVPDLVKHSFMQLSHIDFLEFMEMIGRVADTHYQDEEDTPLYEKINRVLDEWLALIGELRKEPVYFDESGSELSDLPDEAE